MSFYESTHCYLTANDKKMYVQFFSYVHYLLIIVVRGPFPKKGPFDAYGLLLFFISSDVVAYLSVCSRKPAWLHTYSFDYFWFRKEKLFSSLMKIALLCWKTSHGSSVVQMFLYTAGKVSWWESERLIVNVTQHICMVAHLGCATGEGSCTSVLFCLSSESDSVLVAETFHASAVRSKWKCVGWYVKQVYL